MKGGYNMKQAIKLYVSSIVASVTILIALLFGLRDNKQLMAKYKDIFDTINAMPLGKGIITTILVILMLPVILLSSLFSTVADKFKK